MKKCACRGSFLERFIQPSILLLLNEEPMHGFSILKKLYKSDVMDYSSIDPTGLYRTLKKMEESGLLTSRIETDGGPPGEARLRNHRRGARLPRLLARDAARLPRQDRPPRAGDSGNYRRRHVTAAEFLHLC